jgi:cytochrome c
LLSGGSDEVARRWDLHSGEELGISVTAGMQAPDVIEDPDAQRGAVVFRKCAVCHSVSPDGGRRAGPTLHGVFGRKVGTVPGYNYSDALDESSVVWTADTIARLFDEGPDVMLPGTKMPIQRIPSEEDREALVRYLKEVTEPER